MVRYKDISGQKFGHLTVVKYAYTDERNTAMWLCQCDCGKTCIVRSWLLRNGKKISCGCIRRKNTDPTLQTPKPREVGKSTAEQRLKFVWHKMLDRCYDIDDIWYGHYGERDIKICDIWKDSFEAFYTWALENGYEDGLTIDRIDNDGDYCPENCRWVDMTTQNNNRSWCLDLIMINDEQYTLKEAACVLGTTYMRLYYRIRTKGEDPDAVVRSFLEQQTLAV